MSSSIQFGQSTFTIFFSNNRKLIMNVFQWMQEPSVCRSYKLKSVDQCKHHCTLRTSIIEMYVTCCGRFIGFTLKATDLRRYTFPGIKVVRVNKQNILSSTEKRPKYLVRMNLITLNTLEMDLVLWYCEYDSSHLCAKYAFYRTYSYSTYFCVFVCILMCLYMRCLEQIHASKM